MSEVRPGMDSVPSPERLQPFRELTALQGRILFRDQRYIDPSKNAPPVDAGLLELSVDGRNYNPFEKTAVHDRNQYWEEKGIVEPVAQMAKWKEGMIGLISRPGNRESVNKLSRVFAKIGINGAAFDDTQAQRLYDKYFTGNDSVKLFVKDVVDAYADRSQLTQDIKEIQWLATIFGKESSEIVTNLIDAQMQVKTNPEEFIGKANQEIVEKKRRVNDLDTTVRERELLSHLWRYGEVPEPVLGPILTSPVPRPIHDVVPFDMVTEKGPFEPFPIRKAAKEIIDTINAYDQVILRGDTGSGKTTETPIIMLESILNKPGMKLAITQPLKQITTDTAKRLSTVRGHKVFDHQREISYKNGDHGKLNPHSKVDVIVEGSFLRMLMVDPLLQGYSHVMVDEVHQRKKETDQILGLLVIAQERRKKERPDLPPLKIIASSATIDPKVLIDTVLPQGKDLKVEGRTKQIFEVFPTEEQLRGLNLMNPRDMVRAVTKMFKNVADWKLDPKGNDGVIAFFPGSTPINTTVKDTLDMIRRGELGNALAFPYYGNLRKEKKDEALADYPDSRVHIATTNAIETGLTPQSKILVCIDTGLENKPTYDASLDMSFTKWEKIVRASALQRRGRVGRNLDGVWLPLYTEEDFKSRDESNPPEILNANLSTMLLTMKRTGSDYKTFNWITPPPEPAVRTAIQTLKMLGALDEHENLTDIGYDMAMVPTEPRMSKLVVEANMNGHLREAAAMAILAENLESVFRIPRSGEENYKEAQAFLETVKDEKSDFLTLLNVWKEYEKQGVDPDPRIRAQERIKWAREHFLNDVTLSDTLRAVEYVESLFNDPERSKTRKTGSKSLEECIRVAFADRMLEYVGMGTKTQQNGRRVQVPLYKSLTNPHLDGATIAMTIDEKSMTSGKRPPAQRVIMASNNPNKSVVGEKTIIDGTLCHILD